MEGQIDRTEQRVAGRHATLGGRFKTTSPTARDRPVIQAESGRHPTGTYNRCPFDIATLAIFPEHIEFDGEEVLRLVVEGAAGRTIK